MAGLVVKKLLIWHVVTDDCLEKVKFRDIDVQTNAGCLELRRSGELVAAYAPDRWREYYRVVEEATDDERSSQ